MILQPGNNCIDAYEQALRYDDEDQWQEEEEEQPINMPVGIVYPRPVMTFRAPNTFLVIHFLMSLLNQRGSHRQAVLDMLCEENEATPNTPPCNFLRRYLSFEKKISAHECALKKRYYCIFIGISAIINSRCCTNF